MLIGLVPALVKAKGKLGKFRKSMREKKAQRDAESSSSENEGARTVKSRQIKTSKIYDEYVR
jgi:Sec-independent protein translocase protein TatA